jgi:CheY-like chemotaxis protein
MNILVVEDEALVALLVQEVVEEAGHACLGPVASGPIHSHDSRVRPNFGAQSALDGICPGNKRLSRTTSVGEACALIDSCHVDAALLDIWLKDDEFVYPAAWKLASRGVPFAFVTARAADGIDPTFADRPLIPKPMDERRVKGWLEGIASASANS